MGVNIISLKISLSHVISHYTFPSHTPKHNGPAKHRNHHIVEMELTLSHQPSLPLHSGPLYLLQLFI